MFPSRPAERGGFTYLKSPRLATSQPRRQRARRLRAWWRRHWWPARIRDLEAEVRYLSADLWGD